MMTAFSNIKAALLRSVCPAFPQDKAELSLAPNASATHVGAVLQQRETSTAAWRPLGFFLAKLEQAQLSYSAFDRELYGIFADICHFIHHLEGHRFTIWTDYKPLPSPGCPTHGQPGSNDSSPMWPSLHLKLSMSLAG